NEGIGVEKDEHMAVKYYQESIELCYVSTNGTLSRLDTATRRNLI
ncbi:2369_t:CDS:1, partial [Acaulospora morrowiae]